MNQQAVYQILVAKGLVSQTALDASLAEQRLSSDGLGAIMVRNGLVTRHELLAAMHETNDPDLFASPFESTRVEHGLLLELQVMLLGEIGGLVLLASPSPRWLVEKRLQPYFEGWTFQWLDYDPQTLDNHMGKLRSYTVERGLDRVLRRAVMSGVSDIHLVPKVHSYTLFHRVRGIRQVVEEIDRDEAIAIISQAKDRSRIDIAERSLPQDGAFRQRLVDRAVDFRVATIPEIDGEKMVIRVLDPEAAFPELEALGLTHVDEWMAAASGPRGLCLVCGPTGSGKTTTLNATLRRLNRFERSIQSVEDPVEFRLAYIGQVNINRSKGLDFPRALRGFMRADPDVIMVGEIRDVETARVAIQAAETGHMVLGTIHADTALGGVTRLQEMGIPIESFAHVLRASMAQKLVRTICPVCMGTGCAACDNTGYAGRTQVSEVATFKDREDLYYQLESGGSALTSMLSDAYTKMALGLTDQKEILRVFGGKAREMPVINDDELESLLDAEILRLGRE